MTQNDQLYDFLKAVYDQITPERVYSWIKADSNGRGVLRRMDYAYGFSHEKHPDLKTSKEDENPNGLLNILASVTNEYGVKYCELGDKEIREVICRIEDECIRFKVALSHYLTANYHASETIPSLTFEKCFCDVEDEVTEFATYQLLSNSIFYRLRELSKKRGRKGLEFYHIPFTERYLMGTYRYSIPGYPSLYAASSVYGAWEEMGRKSVVDFGYIAFKTKQQVRLLDLRWRFDINLTEDKETLKAYIRKLPILIACSMQVRHSRERFVPEYVIPQQVFKWLMGKLRASLKYSSAAYPPVWGIIYTSNKDDAWKEICRNEKFFARINYEDITNYALLAYLPIEGDFSQYSYDLGAKLYVSTPYWLKEQPSARECVYSTLNSVQRHFENPRLKWQDLGDEIKKAETN